MIKLSKILFESTDVSYTAPTFCLLKTKGSLGTVLALVKTEPFKNIFTRYNPLDISIDTVEETCAAFVEVKQTEHGCMLALEVKYVASSTEYPGAGKAIYELAGEFFGQPLTSDRSHSTSDAAKKRWAKIEQDKSNWKSVGANEDLDNYFYPVSGEKMFVKFSGHYPNRKVKELGPEGQTPETIDDCKLPTQYGLDTELDDISNNLGTAGAYEYIGPAKVGPLFEEGLKVIDNLDNPKKVSVDEVLELMTDALFNTRY